MDNTEGGALSWGPDHRWIYLTAAMLLGGAAWLLLDRNAENRLVAAVVAAVGLAVTAVLLRVRVRLAADAAGLTVTGPLRTRRIDWAAIAAIETPRRGRFGRRGASLELEVRADTADADTAVHTGTATEAGTTLAPDIVAGPAAGPGAAPYPDTELLVFTRTELGADPAAVGRALIRLAAQAGE